MLIHVQHVGSGYSIISEIEHQLGLRGNKSTITPGQETINEEEEKRKFFEDLEKGHTSSLDYSELNRRLDDNTSLSHSLRYVHVLCIMNYIAAVLNILNQCNYVMYFIIRNTDRIINIDKTLNTIDEGITS